MVKKIKKSKLLTFLICINMILSLIPFIGIAINSSASEPPEIEWEKTFGGNNYEEGYCVQQSSDGGYIIVGWTNSFGAGGDDVYLIKTNSSGIVMWEKTFGGNNYDVGRCVQQTNDSGYIIVGWTNSSGAGGYDFYVIKTDFSGNEIWNKTFGGSKDDYGQSIQQTKDGGYIIVGSTESYGAGGADVYLIKIDSNGNKLWERTFGGSRDDRGYSVKQTSDGGYIIVGNSESYKPGDGYVYPDIYLIKTDSNGIMSWYKTFVGGNYFDYGYSVQQTSDGGYIIAGEFGNVPCLFCEPESDGCIIKTDSLGNEVWNKTFGRKESRMYDSAHSIQQTNDSGYMIGGTIRLSETNSDMYLLKLDSNGKEIWNKTIGGRSYEHGYYAQQTKDGGYIIVGYTESFGSQWQVYLAKLEGLLIPPYHPFPPLINPPIADFTYSPENPSVNQIVQFIDNSSDVDGNIVSWFWDFGDGVNSTERNTSHRYNDSGTYNVSLTVTDDSNATNTTKKQITINQPPVPEFDFTISGLTVCVNASKSIDPDGNIVHYKWDFGDGEEREGLEVEHTYTKPGRYTITLTVTDNSGITNTLSKSINIQAGIPSEIIILILIICIIVAVILLLWIKKRKKV